MTGLIGRWIGLYLLAALPGAGPAASQPATRPTTQPATRPAAKTAPGDVKGSLRRLWQESLAPPQTGESARLRQTMTELRGMQVSARGWRPGGEGAAPPEGATTRPAGPSTQPATTQPALATQPATPTRALPQKVLEQLKAMPAGGISRPVVLADELYRGGYLGAAFTLYEKACGGATDPNTVAWALYQMGNCRRQADPAAAEGLYLRVVNEHASSPWAEPAGIEQKLLEWQRVNQPRKLLESIRQIGRRQESPATTRPATTRPAATVARGGP